MHKIYNNAITVRLTAMPKMMKSGTFSKRSGAATKGFEYCEFWFQMAFLILMQFCILGLFICLEQKKNRKIPLALYEPRYEKTRFLHMRKKRRRSASR